MGARSQHALGNPPPSQKRRKEDDETSREDKARCRTEPSDRFVIFIHPTGYGLNNTM